MDPTLLTNPVERRKAVRLKVRPDLQITEQKYEGKIFHVVKDPVCLRYYRFNKQEYLRLPSVRRRTHAGAGAGASSRTNSSRTAWSTTISKVSPGNS